MATRTQATQRRGYIQGDNAPRYATQAAALAAIEALNAANIPANAAAICKAAGLSRGQLDGVLRRTFWGKRDHARLLVAGGDDGVRGIVWTLRASGESWLRWFRFTSPEATYVD